MANQTELTIKMKFRILFFFRGVGTVYLRNIILISGILTRFSRGVTTPLLITKSLKTKSRSKNKFEFLTFL